MFLQASFMSILGFLLFMVIGGFAIGLVVQLYFNYQDKKKDK